MSNPSKTRVTAGRWLLRLGAIALLLIGLLAIGLAFVVPRFLASEVESLAATNGYIFTAQRWAPSTCGSTRSGRARVDAL